jgi:Ni,Fe-hydrogenase I cytochrome b subunit
MAEYQRGSMDIRTQEKTFEGFIRLVSWGAVIAIGVLIFMALVDG